MNQFTENEIPKYLKQKESDISKANKKSKHKHQYEECLIRYSSKIGLTNKPTTLITSLYSYCTICGKIGVKLNNSIVVDYNRIRSMPNGKTFHYIIPNEELYERYHDKLPVFYVKDIYKDKYVNLKEND